MNEAPTDDLDIKDMSFDAATLRADAPEVSTLRTGNAQSNAAMLDINTEMGFQPSHLVGFWQADLSILRKYRRRLGSARPLQPAGRRSPRQPVHQ